jgi:hypothetical protein
MLRSILIFIMVFGFSFGAFAISEEDETNLLLKAISAGATTPEQKSITQKYIASLVSKKQKEAEKYRQLAKVNQGGKFSSQQSKKQEYLRKAEALDNLAKEYQAIGDRYSEVATN